MGKGATSGRRDFRRSTVSHSRRKANAAGVRAQTPRLALPPLSPERAPNARPSGTRTVSPDGGGGSAIDGGAIAGASSVEPPGAGAIAIVSPSKITRSRSWRASTSAGQYTRYGCASPGGVRDEKPGTVDSASSTTRDAKRRPTSSASGDITVTRRYASA